jgi:membrane protein
MITAMTIQDALKDNHILETIIQTFKNWNDSDPFTHSAATSYYAIFSLPGLLILVIGFVGLFLSETQVEGVIMDQVTATFGYNAADRIYAIMEKTKEFGNDPIAIVIGASTLFFAATGVFVQLQRALNKIWGVGKYATKNYLKFIKMRLISLSMIIVIGFLLMLSLTITTLLTAVATWLSAYLPDVVIEGLIAMNTAISWGITTLLFSAMYFVMPDTRVKFKHCLSGGLLAAILFEIGESALNFYFSQAQPESAFGATGFLILIMVWVFYSCNILLLGAHYTKVRSDKRP